MSTWQLHMALGACIITLYVIALGTARDAGETSRQEPIIGVHNAGLQLQALDALQVKATRKIVLDTTLLKTGKRSELIEQLRVLNSANVSTFVSLVFASDTSASSKHRVPVGEDAAQSLNLTTAFLSEAGHLVAGVVLGNEPTYDYPPSALEYNSTAQHIPAVAWIRSLAVAVLNCRMQRGDSYLVVAPDVGIGGARGSESVDRWPDHIHY